MGKKDEVILSSSHLLTTHGSFCIWTSESTADCQVPLDPNLESSTFSPTSVGFDKAGSCHIYWRNVSLLCPLSAQEAGHDIRSQGPEQSLA